jgi:hypothetical protein
MQMTVFTQHLRCLLIAAIMLLLTGAAAHPDGAGAPDHVYNVVPSIVEFHQTGPRNYSVVFAFDVREKLPPGTGTFVHFTRDGEILLYMGLGIESAPENWPVGQIVKGNPVYGHFPPVLADGSYPILVGLWTPATGKRLKLKGVDDGGQRYQAGILVVTNHGRTLSLQHAPTIGEE